MLLDIAHRTVNCFSFLCVDNVLNHEQREHFLIRRTQGRIHGLRVVMFVPIAESLESSSRRVLPLENDKDEGTATQQQNDAYDDHDHPSSQGMLSWRLRRDRAGLLRILIHV